MSQSLQPLCLGSKCSCYPILDTSKRPLAAAQPSREEMANSPLQFSLSFCFLLTKPNFEAALYPDKRWYFPGSSVTRWRHVSKFWPMHASKLCGNIWHGALNGKGYLNGIKVAQRAKKENDSHEKPLFNLFLPFSFVPLYSSIYNVQYPSLC